jgi:(1->4)-alpha-D-glucan 1-alpha-D-glucosylmutase
MVAFDRGGAITVATRLPVGLEAAGGWGDTTLDLPAGEWRDLLTDTPATPRLAELLGALPVALLVQEGS